MDPQIRDLMTFVERDAPFLFDGSYEADGVLDSDLATYNLVVTAMRDGLEDATRQVANENGLDIRRTEDRREALRLVDAADPTWSMARNFDELSSSAQTTVIRSAKQLASRLALQRRNRGTLGGKMSKMLDPGIATRQQRMEDMARRHGHDLRTHAGRRAALDDVYSQDASLRSRLRRPGDGNVPQSVQGTMGVGPGIQPHLADVLDGKRTRHHTERAGDDGKSHTGIGAHTPSSPAIPRGGWLF